MPSLKKLVDSRHELLAVVTQPDRKKGRHLHVVSSPVKIEAQRFNIPIHQPEDLSRSDSIDLLKKLKADLFIVVAFGQILNKDVLQIPEGLCVNLHASALPRYRGAAPVNWSIINGEKITGVTTIRMNDKMDRGDIILKKETPILDTQTSATLNKKLASIGAELLLETIDLVEKEKATFTKQNENEASFAPKLKREDGLIDWKMSARAIHNRVRGLIPWPSAYTHWSDKLIKIWKSAFNENSVEKAKKGSILRLNDNGIVVGTGRGELIIKELQLEGGKRLKAEEFLRGHKLKVGDKLK